MGDFNENGEVFSKRVKAGKRTYFFDVKETKAGEYYITLTESKKRFNEESGKFFFEKHKLFLYKEDYTKFQNGLDEVLNFIQENQGYDKDYERYSDKDDSDNS
ncbi:MAG: DNA-binding protein [Bacteroidetes bacterium 4572_112]|nr:MAG: DNA-binding protein [Bacteroidetes bacterium 4572_112]